MRFRVIVAASHTVAVALCGADHSNDHHAQRRPPRDPPTMLLRRDGDQASCNNSS